MISIDQAEHRREQGIVTWADPDGNGVMITPHRANGKIFVSLGEIQQAGIRRLIVGQSISFRRFMASDGRVKATDLSC